MCQGGTYVSKGDIVIYPPPIHRVCGVTPPTHSADKQPSGCNFSYAVQHDTAAAAIATTAATPKSQELQPQARDNINSLRKNIKETTQTSRVKVVAGETQQG